MNEYLTVKKRASDEFTEKRSRFIGYCTPVKTEEEAVSFINEIRAKHRDANHNVYAYLIRDNNISRFSDDGEPSATAGLPVFDVLRKEGLTDVAVVVTRYFGGILLGGGGLVRAYTNGAKIAVDASKKVLMLPCSEFSVKCDYSMYEKLRYAFEMKGYVIENSDFKDSVTIFVSCKVSESEDFKALVEETSFSRASVTFIKEKYASVEV